MALIQNSLPNPNRPLSQDEVIDRALTSSQQELLRWVLALFTPAVIDTQLTTRDIEIVIAIGMSPSYECYRSFYKTLCAEDASRFLQFRNQNERKGLFLSESLLRLDGVNQESVNAKLWTVLSGIAKSAPVNLLGYVVAEQDEHPAENRPGKWTWQELALFMAIAVSVFPDLFKEIEKVEALRWLSSVRDFTSLSDEEQDSFLDSLGHRFDMDTTSEEWREQKAISRRIVATETIHELPAGLCPFRNWAKLKDLTPEKFMACEQEVQHRLRAALILRHLPGFNWTTSVVRHSRVVSELDYLKSRIEDATAEAREIVKRCELRREQLRKKNEQLAQQQLQATLQRAEELQAVQRQELAQFHQDFQLTPIDLAAEKLLSNFAKASVKHIEQPYQKAFLEAVASVRELFLDYRGEATSTRGDPKIKQLTDILLSPTNLTIVACALGNDTTKHFLPFFVPDRTPVVQPAEDLGRLYAEYPAARKQVDEIISETSLAVVVAAAVLPIDEVRSFVTVVFSKGVKAEEKFVKHQEFTNRIRKALLKHDDIRAVKSLRREVAGDVKSDSSKGAAIEIPEWLTTKLADYRNFTCFIDPVDDAVVIFLNPELGDTPQVYFEVPKAILKSPAGFDTFFSRELDKAYKQKEYADILTELMNLGLNVEIISGDEQRTRVWHAGAQIDKVFFGDVRDIRKLSLLKAQFEEYLGLSETLLEFAFEAGFTRIEDSKSGNIKLQLQGEAFVNIPTVVSPEQFDDLTRHIGTLIAKHTSAQEIQNRRERNRQREEERATLETKPVAGEKILIIDANVLLMWSAPVPKIQERTFLEVLKAYAGQTGSRIWIPARVVYEVLGDVLFLNAQNQVERISIRTYSREISQPIKELIDGAAHLALLDSDDESLQGVQYRVKRGTGSRITIVYTPEDLDFFNEARRSQEHSRDRAIFAQRFVKADLGDQAITDILSRFDIAECELSVVTADRKYAEGCMPVRAGNGSYVRWRKPFSLLYSAMRLRADRLVDFPSAEESKEAIWRWLAARAEENA